MGRDQVTQITELVSALIYFFFFFFRLDHVNKQSLRSTVPVLIIIHSTVYSSFVLRETKESSSWHRDDEYGESLGQGTGLSRKAQQW